MLETARRNNPTQGIISELEFDKKVLHMGWVSCIPVAPAAFDRMVWTCRPSRVQIKSTTLVKENGDGEYYKVGLAQQNKRYNLDDIDHVALHLVVPDLWYILPVIDDLPTTIKVYPRKGEECKYHHLQGRWDLLEI